MGNKAEEISGDPTVATLNAKAKNLALITRQQGRILSKWLERRERQLDMVPD